MSLPHTGRLFEKPHFTRLKYVYKSARNAALTPRQREKTAPIIFF